MMDPGIKDIGNTGKMYRLGDYHWAEGRVGRGDFRDDESREIGNRSWLDERKYRGRSGEY